ncbi:MAG TPA: MarR family transcriptional regulator [Acidimicrobiales bacterium]|nr:MarR family transcriptional regulator [Acidimicrobiales bacterium]
MTTPGEDAVAGRLQRFGLARDRMRAALARRARISETDLDALEHLEADGPLSQRDLGDRLSITSGAVTMLIDRLESAGWVRRGPHPTDRRFVLVELTERAATDVPAGLVVFHERIRSIANGVPAGHRQALCDFLDAASDAAAAAAEDLGR